MVEIQSNTVPGQGPEGCHPFLWNLIVFTDQSHLMLSAGPFCRVPHEPKQREQNPAETAFYQQTCRSVLLLTLWKPSRPAFSRLSFLPQSSPALPPWLPRPQLTTRSTWAASGLQPKTPAWIQGKKGVHLREWCREGMHLEHLQYFRSEERFDLICL